MSSVSVLLTDFLPGVRTNGLVWFLRRNLSSRLKTSLRCISVSIWLRRKLTMSSSCAMCFSACSYMPCIRSSFRLESKQHVQELNLACFLYLMWSKPSLSTTPLPLLSILKMLEIKKWSRLFPIKRAWQLMRRAPVSLNISNKPPIPPVASHTVYTVRD